ncbi:DNA (cytosine-5-)-methyltransferase [Leuconostoc lactis]|uniref:DNA (cytosine-5-)-methyltransferase n=1 Tax=Leuconostoc mesenteroides TaxID=1245 RepID=UPI0009FE2A75|nr:MULTISPECIES: DNA (cytosine-5-)-methyltransferase [Leuconostoc]MCM6832702.1 DNA (cytosine-5-)-methyltransferase [Leuconostoc mesenteroides]ORI82797.1 DNA (cytosine-5-)-methyltransferase [Leuconostoc lactis]ORI85841.1 DNA (cytosine-5-)-methyltransferase [Leuconostoc lactis]
MEFKLNNTKVLELMTLKGIHTQTELAQQLGISKNQLSIILSDKFNPLKSTVARLTDILGEGVMLSIEPKYKETEFDLRIEGTETSFPDTFVNTDNIVSKRTFNVLELFAGAGGLALGLEQAGLQDIGLVEFDKYAAATLRKNRPNWNVIEQDITKITDDSTNGIYDYIDPSIELDVLSGGFPCQSFSYAGKRLGIEDTRGTLFYNYAHILKQTHPKMFIAENVRGLVTHDHGRTLKTIIDVFEQIGYHTTYRVLNAWDYGVAQKRQRMILIGIRNDLDITYEFPKPFVYKPVLRDVLTDVPNSPGQAYSPKKAEVMKLVPAGGYWRDLPDQIARDYMGVSYFSGGGRTGMARRISWDEPSLTLTTSPSQKQTERAHPDENRPFTTREYARIQSFPDNWEFEGSTNQIYKQIGNAVAVNFAKQIGLSVINSLNQLV